MHPPSLQQSWSSICYITTVRVFEACFAPGGPLSVNLPRGLSTTGLRVMLEWQWHKHSIIISLSEPLSLGTRCRLFKLSGIWEMLTVCWQFHSNICFASLYFVISVQRKTLLCVCSSVPVGERRRLPAPLSSESHRYCYSMSFLSSQWTKSITGGEHLWSGWMEGWLWWNEIG